MTSILAKQQQNIISHDGISIHFMPTMGAEEAIQSFSVLFANPDLNSDTAAIEVCMDVLEGKPCITSSLYSIIGDMETKNEEFKKLFSSFIKKVNVLGDFAGKVPINERKDVKHLSNHFFAKELGFLSSVQHKTPDDYTDFTTLYREFDLSKEGAEKSFPAFLELLGNSNIISDNPEICQAICAAVKNMLEQTFSKSNTHPSSGLKMEWAQHIEDGKNKTEFSR